jgi:hypothetical protein
VSIDGQVTICISTKLIYIDDGTRRLRRMAALVLAIDVALFLKKAFC